MIEPAELAELRAFAVDAARAAGRITLESFGGPQRFETKPDGSPVTDVDRRAEELLRERIASAYPADGVLGEEFGAVEGTSGRRWTVDPIDGTISFLHGVPLYGVLIGLLEGEESVVGVVHLPALDETLAAARGSGCSWWRSGGDPVPARVRATPRLEEALVLCTDVFRLDIARVDLEGRVGRLRTWGDCYGHALVATGRADAMIDPRMSAWDSVPLLPVVEEAGGRFTTVHGERRAAGGSALSTCGPIHDDVLDLLGTLGGAAADA
ncbi:MAG TPA: inositol monophosphatase family protein [Gemmatimonadota bacterium]|nr:inositol monophosphatase family protein [Gemmatimonadota bacterium]